MIPRRPFGLVWIALLAISADASAQRAEPSAAAGTPPSWTFSATVYGYQVPSGTSYVLPIVTADHGALHLEGRYNYESLESASLFAGWTFTGGEHLHVAATPMLGFVFGDLEGAAPGVELTLGISRFELYTEVEYVLDFAGRIGRLPLPLVRGHVRAVTRVACRTRRTALADLCRADWPSTVGPLLGWQPGDWGASATVFDPFTTDVFYVLSVSVSF